MKRKDGLPKQKSKRNKPEFTHGFREAGQVTCDLTQSVPQISVVSLFSGCGGLDLGFEGGFDFLGANYERLPFRVDAAFDNLGDAIETYKFNLGDAIESLDLATADIVDLPKADVLIGGFPCQDFSSSGPKVGLKGERGQLYTVLRDYMQEHQPKVVIGENVPHLRGLNKGKYLEKIVSDFEGCGYKVAVWELFGPDYGLPQSRRRLIIACVRADLNGFPVKPKPTHTASHVPIDVALSDLVDITDESVTNQSQFFIASKASSGGGQGDHTNQIGKVAYCIRANSRGRIQFHHSLGRRLTVRECARLQSFPDEFVFPFTTQRNLTLIGNAVPPIMGHAVAKSVRDFLFRAHVAKETQCDFERVPVPIQASLAL